MQANKLRHPPEHLRHLTLHNISQACEDCFPPVGSHHSQLSVHSEGDWQRLHCWPMPVHSACFVRVCLPVAGGTHASWACKTVDISQNPYKA